MSPTGLGTAPPQPALRSLKGKLFLEIEVKQVNDTTNNAKLAQSATLCFDGRGSWSLVRTGLDSDFEPDQELLGVNKMQV